MKLSEHDVFTRALITIALVIITIFVRRILELRRGYFSRPYAECQLDNRIHKLPNSTVLPIESAINHGAIGIHTTVTYCALARYEHY